MSGQETRGIIWAYPVFRQKSVNIRIAFSNILRHRLVCKSKTTTSLHIHQFARDVFENSDSERATSSDVEYDSKMKTHCAKAVLRSASASSRGWGSSNKKFNSRRTREVRLRRFALFRLVVWNVIRRNAAKQIKRPYVNHLNDVEQAVDGSLERGSCYGNDPCDSLDHRRDEFDDIGSFGKSRVGWTSGWGTRIRCRASGWMRTLLMLANRKNPARGEKPLRVRGHDCRLRAR